MIRSLLPAFGLLVAACLLLPLAVPSPRAGEPVAVVFAPGLPAAEAMARVLAAGGSPIRAGGFANIVVARSDDPGFSTTLHQQGAWLLLDPVLAGCADLRRTKA